MARQKNEKDLADHAFITPVTRTTLTADICRKMVMHLMRGDWAEGDRIPAERELCQKLGVGRASLREALKALEIMGMIETRLGDGTYVCNRSEFLSRPLLWAIASSTEAEAHELVEARKLIEVELAGFAAERATAEDLKAIDSYMAEMETAVRQPAVFLEADLNFHLAITRAGHNRLLLNAVHLIRNLMRQWIGRTLSVEGVAQTALTQHRAIFEAVASKDAAGARAAMSEHLNAMAAFLLENPERREEVVR